MGILRLFLVIFGLMLAMGSLVVGNARRHITDALWTVQMTAVSYRDISHVTILPDGRTTVESEQFSRSDAWMTSKRSPDGQWGVFVEVGGATSRLVRIGRDGGEGHTIAGASNRSGGIRNIFWSPNSEWIVFSAILRSDQGPTMVVMRWDGSQRVDIPIAEFHYNYAWSSDSEWILFYRLDENGVSLWRVARDGTDMRQVLAVDAVNMNWASPPIVSPDNEWLYFDALVEGAPQVFRCRPDGSDLEEFYISRHNILMSVSPSGNYIAIAAAVEGQVTLYQVRVDGIEDGTETIPISRPAPDFPARVTWSADEEAVVYAESVPYQWNLVRYSDGQMTPLYTFWGDRVESLDVMAFETMAFRGIALGLVGGLLVLMGLYRFSRRRIMQVKKIFR